MIVGSTYAVNFRHKKTSSLAGLIVGCGGRIRMGAPSSTTARSATALDFRHKKTSSLAGLIVGCGGRIRMGAPSSTTARSATALDFRHKKTSSLAGLIVGCGGRIRTDDLRVMSPTSYQAAPPRDRGCAYYARRHHVSTPMTQMVPETEKL